MVPFMNLDCMLCIQIFVLDSFTKWKNFSKKFIPCLEGSIFIYDKNPKKGRQNCLKDYLFESFVRTFTFVCVVYQVFSCDKATDKIKPRQGKKIWIRMYSGPQKS